MNRPDPEGICPHCGETIPADDLLIRFEYPSGWRITFAGCEWCDVVVEPDIL